MGLIGLKLRITRSEIGKATPFVDFEDGLNTFHRSVTHHYMVQQQQDARDYYVIAQALRAPAVSGILEAGQSPSIPRPFRGISYPAWDLRATFVKYKSRLRAGCTHVKNVYCVSPAKKAR